MLRSLARQWEQRRLVSLPITLGSDGLLPLNGATALTTSSVTVGLAKTDHRASAVRHDLDCCMRGGEKTVLHR